MTLKPFVFPSFVDMPIPPSPTPDCLPLSLHQRSPSMESLLIKLQTSSSRVQLSADSLPVYDVLPVSQNKSGSFVDYDFGVTGSSLNIAETPARRSRDSSWADLFTFTRRRSKTQPSSDSPKVNYATKFFRSSSSPGVNSDDLGTEEKDNNRRSIPFPFSSKHWKLKRESNSTASSREETSPRTPTRKDDDEESWSPGSPVYCYRGPPSEYGIPRDPFAEFASDSCDMEEECELDWELFINDYERYLAFDPSMTDLESAGRCSSDGAASDCASVTESTLINEGESGRRFSVRCMGMNFPLPPTCSTEEMLDMKRQGLDVTIDITPEPTPARSSYRHSIDTPTSTIPRGRDRRYSLQSPK